MSVLEAYSIAVKLELRNLISPQLKILSDEFAKLEGLSKSLSLSLKGIGTESAGLKSLAAAGNASNRALEKAALSASALQKQLLAIRATSGGMGGGLPILPMPGGGGAGGGGRGAGGGAGTPILPGRRLGGGGGGGHGGGRGGGFGPGGGFHGGNIHMGPHGIGLGTAGMAAGDWFWPLAVTGAAIYGGHSLYESAKDLNTQQNKLRILGMTDQQNAEAFKFVSGMKVYGSTQIENMTAFREAQGVFRESGESGSAALAGAKLAAPVLAKLNFLSASLDDASAAQMKSANMAMLRYVESSGGLASPAEFNRIANFGFKLNESSGGTVNWEQLRQFKARAGAAGFNLSDDAMARLEPTIAESKGSTTGYGLRTAYNRLTGVVRLPNQVLHELVDQGVWDRKKIIFNSGGGVKNFTDPRGPMSKDKVDMLSANPELFYETYIRPIYIKMKLDNAEIARQNAMIFGGTGGANATLWEKQLATIHRGIDAIAKAKGINDAVEQQRKSLSGQEQEFSAAWTDFKTQWGTAMLPAFSGMLKSGATVLRTLHDAKVGGVHLTGVPIIDTLGSAGIAAAKAWTGISSGAKGTSLAPNGGFGRQPAQTINLIADGKKLQSWSVPLLMKGVSAPQTGINIFDGRQALQPPGSP